ncbi:putative K domain-containing protein [Helianthus annuus]|uniref:K domain-containing protein n=1 Tax=Helianthus annuus TaxID=4232 RepID=A0A251UPZ8_HELAN|nr:RNA-binding KH domain-containing protein PEPPER [Helianthus annuus]KAF5804828.1 putative K domain-containing protein [Helianthus annuus]KAJ0569400.1 putative K domain-containing protein [Helianthus annuus]KAJ0575862.1 putative K domain-containing protein [Helianthus annuus]KAJ0583711.1 putative K domain-containing protein [Helianthus annuus]KAJ0746433.1 putative K domain-containing protein [Helianthus annuus]
MASTLPSINGTVTETTQSVTTASIPPGMATETDPAAKNPPATAEGTVSPEKKWPGWPGDCVFRLIVPVLKVGSIIGRKGDIIKKMCEDTKARIRVLDATVGTPDRIVLISGKEEPELPFSPAMDAVIRVFKRVNGFPENEGESLASIPFCSIRLLVPSTQAISLIGKQGSSIKAIQESTGCSVRVLSGDEVSAVSANSDERIVDMQGEAIKVLKALEAVVGHLRKFLVDHSILPLFEQSNNAAVAAAAAATQEHQVETSWADKPMMRSTSGLQSQLGLGGVGDFSLPMRRETLFADREPQRESLLTSHGLSLYGRDPGLPPPATLSPALARTGGPIVTQIAQTMQIPLVYAEDIIGVGGTNIAYIRRTSGAILTVQESRGLPDEITVEIKGTASQVQTAQQLIQECVNKESSNPSSYGKLESSLRSSYSQLGNSSYPPPASSAYGGPSYGAYGAPGLGGYSSSYRM